MALRSISKMGHPVLRKVARELGRDDLLSREGQRLVEDMIDTMRDAEGVGLAAPQVYENVRLIVAEIRSSEEDEESRAAPLLVLANPVVVEASEEKALGWEGCLSIPEIYGKVWRHRKISVKGLNGRGKPVTVEAEGYFARVIQHEMDHLDGVLFMDRMEDLKTLTYKREMYRYWMEETE